MKKLLRDLANRLGYDFVKVNVHSADKAGKTSQVQIGKFQILMPGNNPQISLYKYAPDSNSQLGRLAKIVYSKNPGASMIDIGANVGDTIAVVKSQSAIPVIAIEGDEFSFSFLQRNMIQFQSVRILKAFLGEEKKELQVSMEKSGWNNTIIPTEGGSKTLDIKTLDELLEQNGLANENIKLLKIDTEGFDTIILRGAFKTISRYHPVLYFEYNGENMRAINEDGFSTLMKLKEFGYKYIHIYDCIDNLIARTTLDNTDMIRQLHDYAHKKRSMIPYFDICIFHSDDKQLAENFNEGEADN